MKPENTNAPLPLAPEAPLATEAPTMAEAAPPTEPAAEAEPAPAPAKARKAKAKTVVVERAESPQPRKEKAKAAKAPAPTKEPTREEPEAPLKDPRGKPRKKRQPAGGANLTQLKEAYVLSLEEDGKSGGTIASYAAEMELALGILGSDTALADLTPKEVQRFFEHDRVTKLRSGKAKSQLSIDKTRRVFRQALVFAAQNGWIAEAPLPKAEGKSK